MYTHRTLFKIIDLYQGILKDLGKFLELYLKLLQKILIKFN